MKALEVWGYTGWRVECPPTANGGRQTREVVAAPSRVAAARLLGITSTRLKEYGSVTGNTWEVRMALASPGRVFWKPLDDRRDPLIHSVWKVAS